MMDDPWDWDTDRLVRELCSLNRTWTPSSNTPKLPGSLEIRLREQEVDGHTLLTYADETELFRELGIETLKHKTTFRDFLGQLRERSQKDKLSQTKPIDDRSTENVIVAPPRKQRRIAPTAVSDENDINAQQFPSYLNPDITQPVRLDTLAGIDGLQGGLVSGLRSYGTDDDIILPLYGDSGSEGEYDSETWEEIQQEQKDKIASGKHLPGFGPEAITDKAIRAFVSDWRQYKLPKLLPRANKLWHDARKYDLNEAISQVRRTLQLYETRLGKLREGILCQRWSNEAELRSVTPALEQTVLALQSASWQLSIVSSPQEPDKPSSSQSAPSHITKSRRSRLDNWDDEETLTSESEGDQGDFIVNDLEPHEGPEAGSDICDPTPPRSSQNDAIFAELARLPVPDSAASRGPPPVVAADNADPHGRKRRHSTTDTQSPESSKRPCNREIIELSSDNDDDETSICPSELVFHDESVDDTHGSKDATTNEFGGCHANRQINDDDWSRLCRLFQCPESTTKLQPPGFSIEILAYQLHAVWWMLTQQPLRGIQGGCLGDAMGLGKTVEVIATFAIFAMMKANHEEVRKFWKYDTTTEGRLHLAEQQTGDETRCPSQRTSPYPTCCTCVKSGDAYKVATTMPTLPTVCVVPPTAMRGWAAEYGKVVDTTHSVASRLKLSVAHEDYKRDEGLYHGEDHGKDTRGVAVQQEDGDGNTRILIKGQVGLASRLILVSRHGATKLHARYDQMRTNITDGNGNVVKANLMGAAFIFFDESHQYNGSPDSPTDPFRLLGALRDSSYKEPSAFAVSASIPMAGPVQLANIVDHILKSRSLQGLDVEIGGISNVGVLKDRQADYRYLLDKLNRAADSKAKKEIDIRRRRLDKLEEGLASLVLMARRPTDEFRGEPIGDGSREIIVESINCPMKDGAAQVAFGRLAAEVRSYVRLTLQRQKQEWEQGGRVGSEPSERSVETNLFGGSDVRARLSGRSGHAWTRLMRAGVYPALARLIEAGRIQDEDLHHEAINPLGAQACKAYLAQGRAAMVNVFESSSLWRCREELKQESAKFAKLRDFVDRMISYRSKVSTADDPSPRDGTNIRHMIVLADSPCSAFITYMQLAYAYEKVKVMLINASTKHEAGASDSGYGRSQIIEDLNSPCNETSPNKILVSTYAICGVALNLQRANYCVMMEPARTTDAEKQAAARVNRRGQDMKPVTVMLYDNQNLAESVRLSRRANHEEMLSWKDNEIPWDTFMC